MPHNEQAESYLWDMREAARDITGFMRGIKFHEFEKNKILRLAVERQLLVIGEAAVHISPQYRDQHSEVEWKIFIGFRNVLAHEYGDTLLNRVWLAATVAVPELLAVLIKLLPDEDEDK
jgi:uncharacterized protein with HEPN domain